MPQARITVERIAPELTKSIRAIDELTLDPENARTHDEFNVGAIKASLTSFGQQTPIVVTKQGVVAKGNGTVIAAQELGWQVIAAIETDLTREADLVAYKIADNKSGDLATWNWQTLADQIKQFPEVDWKAHGWKDYELAPILQGEWKPPAINGDGSGNNSGEKGEPIIVSAEQRVTIDRAIEVVREKLNDPEASEGRCLELICADYLSA